MRSPRHNPTQQQKGEAGVACLDARSASHLVIGTVLQHLNKQSTCSSILSSALILLLETCKVDALFLPSREVIDWIELNFTFSTTTQWAWVDRYLQHPPPTTCRPLAQPPSPTTTLQETPCVWTHNKVPWMVCVSLIIDQTPCNGYGTASPTSLLQTHVI